MILQFAPLIDVRWSRGSNSRCRAPKVVSGHCKGRVKSIPKADSEIGKRVLQIVLKVSGKFIQPGSGKQATYHREPNYASRERKRYQIADFDP